MASVNQTRPHCVNQMGKTHSKPLAARHSRGTAWARHAMCKSAFNVPLPAPRCNLSYTLCLVTERPTDQAGLSSLFWKATDECSSFMWCSDYSAFAGMCLVPWLRVLAVDTPYLDGKQSWNQAKRCTSKPDCVII